MKLITLLHLYQPHNQQLDILDRIVNESYRPLTAGLLNAKKGKVVINISGALTQLLVDNNYLDVINNLKELAKLGRLEFTSSAMYHAFLPLIPKDEIKRQIELNNKTNVKVFGDLYQPSGFFSPEMAVSAQVCDVVSELNYKWLVAPQVAHPTNNPDITKLHKLNSGLIMFFRHKRVSSLMLSGVVRTPKQLLEQTQDLHKKNGYFFVVMDGETFGHHRIGHENFLLALLENDLVQSVLPSEIIMSNIPITTTKIRPSTWTNTEQDFWLDREGTRGTEKNAFILWNDPTNPIHKLQWELTNLAINYIDSNKNKKNWEQAKELLDKAIASDQYWWASTKPWWSLELIEQGAYSLKEVVATLFGSDSSEYKDALDYYYQILDQAFLWQRDGLIRQRHLESSSTYMKRPFKERAPAEWFNQIMLEFDDQMVRSSKSKRFEEAIKWRDALIKIKQGSDIYDVLHVVDELWTARNIPALKPFLDYEWEDISSFIKEYLRGVTTKEDFEVWKKQNL